MHKLNKIRGFVAMPIIIGSAVLAVGILGGLAYEYKNNQSILSVVNKNNLLAQVNGVGTTITVISPNGGESFQQGQTIPITWSSTNMGSLNIEIDLLNSSGAIMEDNRVTLETANTGSYNWTIPTSLPNGSYRIAVSSKDKGPSAGDYSDTFFNIMTSDSLKIISPSSGEQLIAGQTYTVRWSGISTGNNEYSVYLIGGTLYSDGVYLGNAQEMDKDIKGVSVTIPSNLSSASNYQIKFQGKAFESISGVFTISVPTAPAPSFTVTSPNGGESLIIGNSYNITWQSANLPSNDLTSVFLENYNGALICTLGQVPTSFGQMSFDLQQGVCYKNAEKEIIIPGQYKIWLNSSVEGMVDRSDNYFTIANAKQAPTISIYPSSGPIGTAVIINGTGFTSDNVFSLESTGNLPYGIKQFNLPSDSGKSVTLTIPNTLTQTSEAYVGTKEINVVPGIYQIVLSNSNGKSNLAYFTVTVPQPTCTPSTSCVPQYCQYGGDLKKCTVKKSDCSTSSYTTGGCNSAPNYTTCDSTAKAIVDSVGGCEKIDKSLYSNIYNVCCMPAVVTKESLLSMLNNALADGVISSTEKTALLTALNLYLK